MQEQTIGGSTNGITVAEDEIWMSHINVDSCENMGLVFNISSRNRFASIAFTGRLKNDPLNTTKPIQLARQGKGTSDAPYNPYYVTRWGDYCGLVLNPSDTHIFWLYHEYPTAKNQYWGTNVSSFSLQINECPQINSITKNVVREIQSLNNINKEAKTV